ncbi:dihydrofolate reductase family protein [Nocardia anaemiae]|uniref:dihydrofolate reductase family protein n=1 Tax=Nocardia anaemiae TaxID=263910 RepID=UPI0027D8D2DD|nr:dihydrofolate reductase family protein [Nocardia anaemiae]
MTENITLDGVIDASEGWFTVGNDAQGDQSDVLDELMRQSAECDAVLFGRITFEQMRGYWPQQTDDETGIADDLNNVHKYVMSSSLGEPEWAKTTVLRGPLADEMRALKSEPGKDIVTTGSITLVHGLIAADLVDEYRLFVFPVVLGRGARLFEDATHVPALRLVESRKFRSGVVLLRYRTS